jgi:hypothetical protein
MTVLLNLRHSFRYLPNNQIMGFRPNIFPIDKSNDPESFSHKECFFVEILSFQKTVACHKNRVYWKTSCLDKGTLILAETSKIL